MVKMMNSDLVELISVLRAVMRVGKTVYLIGNMMESMMVQELRFMTEPNID